MDSQGPPAPTLAEVEHELRELEKRIPLETSDERWHMLERHTELLLLLDAMSCE